LPVPEQRNPYKGNPPRAWIRAELVAADGTRQVLELLADTGKPCSLIIDSGRLQQFKHFDGPDFNSNFGILSGAWLRLTVPAIGIDQIVLAYANDGVATASKHSDPALEGLAGLPLLRLGEFGGDDTAFWLRT
jgi:hypothetical protein